MFLTEKKNYFSVLALLLSLFLLPFASANAKIIMKPYLQAVSATSIIVMVETDSKEPVTVRYGLDEKLENKAETSFYKSTEERRKTYFHRVKLSGLTPGTKYFYKAFYGGSESEMHDFYTAVKPGVPFRFGAMGDFRNNPEIHSLLAKELKKHEPRMLLYTGDLCGNGSYASWKSEFFVPGEQDLLSHVPMFNGLGNHENYGKLTKVMLQAPDSPSDNEYYYSFDYGDLHVVVINTEGNLEPDGKQWKFVEQDLKSSDKKWKIALYHKPAYSTGSKHGCNEEMQHMAKELFVPYGVCAALNGHTHFYQKNMADGVYHLVLAGGGAPLHNAGNADFVLKTVKDYHYAIFDVSEEKIEVNVYDLYGKVLDNFSITKKNK